MTRRTPPRLENRLTYPSDRVPRLARSLNTPLCGQPRAAGGVETQVCPDHASVRLDPEDG
jgi:hypothetical protein